MNRLALLALSILCLVQVSTGAIINGFARYAQNITTEKGNCNYEVGSYKRFASVGIKVFESSGACGLCIQVKTNRGFLTAAVVDLCLGCSPTDILMDATSFNRIGNGTMGMIPIQWTPVICKSSGGIRYVWKKGSTPWWIALGIRNTAAPVRSLEVFLNNKWMPVKREPYNYFTLISPGPGPFKLRLTSYFNETIIEESVPFMNLTSFKAKGQFTRTI